MRLSILIAEDSPVDRMLLSTIVGKQGHRVLTAADGQEAVALFQQERPQLVLMDALMPVMDGFEAARQIKRLAGDELVPIIFLTSLSENQALVSCLEAGGDDFIAKPYNPIILEAKIQAMHRLRRLQATVLEQRDLIARRNQQLLDEHRAAKAIFDKVAHAGCLSAPNIRYRQSRRRCSTAICCWRPTRRLGRCSCCSAISPAMACRQRSARCRWPKPSTAWPPRAIPAPTSFARSMPSSNRSSRWRCSAAPRCLISMPSRAPCACGTAGCRMAT